MTTGIDSVDEIMKLRQDATNAEVSAAEKALAAKAQYHKAISQIREDNLLDGLVGIGPSGSGGGVGQPRHWPRCLRPRQGDVRALQQEAFPYR